MSVEQILRGIEFLFDTSSAASFERDAGKLLAYRDVSIFHHKNSVVGYDSAQAVYTRWTSAFDRGSTKSFYPRAMQSNVLWRNWV